MEEWIKKSDVVKALNTEAREQFRLDDSYAYVIGTLRNVEDAINSIPSADRPQGEWLPFEFGDERWHKCSCCGTADKYIEYVPRPNGTVGKLVAIRNFCPNCGADMRELATGMNKMRELILSALEGADDE